MLKCVRSCTGSGLTKEHRNQVCLARAKALGAPTHIWSTAIKDAEHVDVAHLSARTEAAFNVEVHLWLLNARSVHTIIALLAVTYVANDHKHTVIIIKLSQFIHLLSFQQFMDRVRLGEALVEDVVEVAELE